MNIKCTLHTTHMNAGMSRTDQKRYTGKNFQLNLKFWKDKIVYYEMGRAFAHMVERVIARKVLLTKPEGKSLRVRPRYRWK